MKQKSQLNPPVDRPLLILIVKAFPVSPKHHYPIQPQSSKPLHKSITQ